MSPVKFKDQGPPYLVYCLCRLGSHDGYQGRSRGGSDDPPFLGANFIHFLHKVLGQRSLQK